VRLSFFLREATRALRRNAVPSFAAMATVVVTVLVLGVFIPVVQATTGAADEVRGKVIADVYLKAERHRARRRPGASGSSRDSRRSARAFISKERPTRRRRSATPRPTTSSARTRCPTPSA
jgi:cell division transport system permease protein